jgi:hypothetical protein
VLEKRLDKKKDATVIVDQRAEPRHRPQGKLSLAGSRSTTRASLPFEQFEDQAGWQEIVREPSPRNEGQHNSLNTHPRTRIK